MKRRLIAFLWILSMCMSLVTPAMAADVTDADKKLSDIFGKNFSGLSSNVFKLSVVFTPIYYTTVAQEEELDIAISNLISELNLSGKSDYEKVKVIYDYYCSSKNTNTFNYNLYL